MVPKLSIIIPTLNEENYLPQLLTGLEKQTFKDFEVILVDGQSEDKTVETATSCRKRLPRLKIIKSRLRRPSVQRNLGARQALSENLLFLDADVLPSPTYLETLLRLTEGKKAEVAVCWLIPLSEKWYDKTFYPLANLFSLELSLKIYPLSTTANMFVRKRAFKELSGFDEGLKVSEDNDFAKRALKRGLNYKVFRRPKIFLSTRRYDEEGRLNYTLKCLKIFLLSAFFGKYKGTAMVDYPYGRY